MNKTFSFPLLFCFFLSINSYSQDMPIGYWRSHLPYNNAVSVVTDGVTLYSASSESFFTYNAANNEITTYSKVEGMADVGIATIGYDATSDYTIIAYTNGNIDLFKDETFFNIPDIKLKTISPKNIHHIYTENGMAYLSTSFGVVVLNLKKKETTETYSYAINNQVIAVRSFTAQGNYFYAITSNGIYKANKNNPNLQAFSAWQLIIPTQNLISSVTTNNTVYVASVDSLYKISMDTLSFIYDSPYRINKIDKN